MVYVRTLTWECVPPVCTHTGIQFTELPGDTPAKGSAPGVSNWDELVKHNTRLVYVSGPRQRSLNTQM